MLKRSPGRPRSEMKKLNAALARFGGLKTFVISLFEKDYSCAEVAEELATVGKVRVSERTIRNWVCYWDAQDQQSITSVSNA